MHLLLKLLLKLFFFIYFLRSSPLFVPAVKVMTGMGVAMIIVAPGKHLGNYFAHFNSSNNYLPILTPDFGSRPETVFGCRTSVKYLSPSVLVCNPSCCHCPASHSMLRVGGGANVVNVNGSKTEPFSGFWAIGMVGVRDAVRAVWNIQDIDKVRSARCILLLWANLGFLR